MVENAETGELLGLDSVLVTELPVELLIYKNATARDSWKTNGAIPENENRMVMLFVAIDRLLSLSMTQMRKKCLA